MNRVKSLQKKLVGTANRSLCLTLCQEVFNEPTEVFSELHLLREHRLHGVVSGLQRVRMVSAEGERVDRLLISFRDAKVHFYYMGMSRD
jgi:hypothetical protein